MFVNIEHPVQLRESKARRKVSSHISKLQYEQKRFAIEQAVQHIQLSAQCRDIDKSISPNHDPASRLPDSASITTLKARHNLPATRELGTYCRRPDQVHPPSRYSAPRTHLHQFGSTSSVAKSEADLIRRILDRAPTPQIFSLNEPDDELRIFTRHAEISMPAILVRRHSIQFDLNSDKKYTNHKRKT